MHTDNHRNDDPLMSLMITDYSAIPNTLNRFLLPSMGPYLRFDNTVCEKDMPIYNWVLNFRIINGLPASILT